MLPLTLPRVYSERQESGSVTQLIMSAWLPTLNEKNAGEVEPNLFNLVHFSENTVVKEISLLITLHKCTLNSQHDVYSLRSGPLNVVKVRDNILLVLLPELQNTQVHYN